MLLLMDSPPQEGKINRLWGLLKRHKWKTIVGAGTLCFTLGSIWWWMRFGKDKLTQYFLRQLLGSDLRNFNIDFDFDHQNASAPAFTKSQDTSITSSLCHYNNNINNNPLKCVRFDKDFPASIYASPFSPIKTTEFFITSLQTADHTTQNLLPILLRRIKVVTNVQSLLEQIRALHSPFPSSTTTNSPPSAASSSSSVTTPTFSSSGSAPTNMQLALLQADSTGDRVERKQLLWQQLKVVALVEWLTSVYALCGLVAYIRLQVILLSSYTTSKEHTDVSDNSPSATASCGHLITDETRRLYLQTNEHFLDKGLVNLVQHITTTITPLLTRYSLDQSLTFADTLQLLGALRQAIETPHISTLWSQVLLPVENSPSSGLNFATLTSTNSLSEADKLILLLNETRDIVESPPFNMLVQKCAHVTFAVTLCYLKNVFGNQSMPVAKLLPLLHHHCSNLLQAENNEILATIAFNKEITDYSLFALQTSFFDERRV